MPVIEQRPFVGQRLLQDAPTEEQLFIARVAIVCSLVGSLAFWIGTLWAVVHFLA